MKQSTKSVAETLFAKHLKELKLSFQTQYKFDRNRRWRADFHIIPHRILIEIDGYFKGRHGAGWGADNEKRNMATMFGYRVLVFSTRDVLNGTAKEFLKSWL